MIKVGVTGGIGSGKTLVCSIFRHLGAPVYNADEEAKKLIHSNRAISNFIRSRFGNSLFIEGKLDRKKLAAIVFNDPAALNDLNAIVHPAVKKDFELWLKANSKAPYIIKEAAILFESGADKGLDQIITVTAPEELRIERVMKRDRVSPIEIKKRMSLQSSDEYKMKKSDYIIVNDGNQLILPQILIIHQQLLENQ